MINFITRFLLLPPSPPPPLPKIAFSAAVTADKFPLVHDYISRMLQDEAVKKTALPPEKHLAFYKKAKESDGQHDYSVADLDGKGVTIYTKKQA